MIDNFFKWLTCTQQEQVHNYLAQSTDLCDLERRMTHLIRGGWAL